MFTLQVQGLANQLLGYLPQPVIDSLTDIFGNCAQELQHRGPVSILTYGDQPSLTLGNDKPGKSALTVNEGNITNNGDLIQNGPAYFNDYATFNAPAIFYDDIVIESYDMIIKYCNPGFGSTIARIKLKEKMSGGKARAEIIDCDGQSVGALPSSGLGETEIEVHDCSNNTSACANAGDCGLAVYMSDCAPKGSQDDCHRRANTGKWEIIKLNSASAAGKCEVEVVDDVCCLADQIVVCKKTLVFTQPVKETKDPCTCPTV